MVKNKATAGQFEMGFYENVLKEAPDFIEALSALGDLYTKEGYYEKGLEVDKRLARLRPDDGVILYNLACSYSLLNDVPRARSTMKAALENGYEDIEYLLQDTDLLNLLSDAKFMNTLKARPKKRIRRSKAITKDKA